jgi:hypothetical protein
MALPLALFALIVVGALVSGNFLAGWLEWQAGHNSIYAAQALAAAQAGLDQALSSADPGALESLSPGGAPLDIGPLLLDDRVSVDCQIGRLTSALYLIRAVGIKRNAAGTALAVRSLGLMARLIPTATESEVTVPGLTPIAERAWVPLF